MITTVEAQAVEAQAREPRAGIVRLLLTRGHLVLWSWRRLRPWLGFGGMAIALALLGVAATQLRSPILFRVRVPGLVAVVVLGVGLGFRGWIRLRARRRHRSRGAVALDVLAVVYGALLILVLLHGEVRFFQQRRRVLAAGGRAEIARWSRHMVVGYTSVASLRQLIARVELAGIFVTARNIHGRSAAQLRAEISSLQALNRRLGRPKLLIMTDQEGGAVTRLSPPLSPLPALGELVSGAGWRRRVRDQATRSADELRAIGVTMNLAPVVDLKIPLRRHLDLHTRLDERAISADPQRVAEAAEIYAEALWRRGVLATAKHFPGLGYVPQDTHQFAGRLSRSEADLLAADWLPYRRLAKASIPVAVMVGHVVATQIDPEHLASSSPVILDLLRREVGHQGLVITDDLCMTPIYRSPGGIAARARDALAAGVDLLLITYDPAQIYPTLDTLSRLSFTRVPKVALRLSAARLRLSRQLRREVAYTDTVEFYGLAIGGRYGAMSRLQPRS
ncbi:MAG: glycoside hydrolase family 3 protein [Deltaproteobacteria bacterium]|nr:glycoside hydrolase family 3 protein [Deltaproteobacteria bacterium]